MTRKKKITLTIILDIAALVLIGGFVCASTFGVFSPDTSITSPVALATPEPTEAVPTPDPTELPENPSTEPSDATPLPAETPVPTPLMWDGILDPKYAGLFLEKGAESISTETSYQSEDIYMTLTAYTEPKLKYWVVDIYVKHVENLRADYGMSDKQAEWLPNHHRKSGALLTVNTDYWVNAQQSKQGWFVRNGIELARNPESRMKWDLCVLYRNGVMETLDAAQFQTDFAAGTNSFDALSAKFPYHVFYFGPALLDENGHAKSVLNTTLQIENPRTVLGYYEPGHYALVIVMGSREVRDINNKTVTGRTGSAGITMTDLAKLCESLGFTAAYNLDGGQSTTMMFGDKLYGHNNRRLTDFLCVVELDN